MRLIWVILCLLAMIFVGQDLYMLWFEGVKPSVFTLSLWGLLVFFDFLINGLSELGKHQNQK